MLRGRGVKLTMAVSFCALFLVDVRVSLHPVYFHSVGIGAAEIGWILAAGTAFAFLTRLVLGRLVGKVDDGSLIAVMLGISGVCVWAVVLTDSLPVILALSAVSGATLGIVQPMTILLTADYTREGEAGLGIGLRMLANRSAQAANPAMFGALTPLVGLAPAIGGVGLLVGLVGVVTGRMLKKMPPNAA
jgi:MFS family permease